MIPKQKTNVTKIIKLRGLGYSQKDIADELGISQPAISRHLKKIKSHAKENGLIKSRSVKKKSSEKQNLLIKRGTRT